MGVRPNWKPENVNPGPGKYTPNKEATLEGFNAMMRYEGCGSVERLTFPKFGTDEQISGGTYNPSKPFGKDG